MAKRKTDVSKVPDVSKDLKEPGEKGLNYTVGRWGWHDQYICNFCQFDTLRLAVMEEHLMQTHGVRRLVEPESGISVSAADAEGNAGTKTAEVYEVELKE